MGCSQFGRQKRERGKHIETRCAKDPVVFCWIESKYHTKSMNGSDSREFNFDQTTKLKVFHQKTANK